MATRWARSRAISELYEEVPEDDYEAVSFLANVTHHMQYSGVGYKPRKVISDAVGRIQGNG